MRTPEEKERLRQLLENEDNWGFGVFGAYFCKEDPRLVVPRRRLLGGTFNFAHRLAIPLFTGVILILIGVILALAFAGSAQA